MLEKHTGIVLNQTKYNDQSYIVHLYTRNAGRMHLWVPISRSRKSGTRSALFLPLSLLEFEVDRRPGKDLLRLREAKARLVFQSIPYHPLKSSIAFFLAEFLYRTLKTEETDETLFQYLSYSIQWLDASESCFSNFHLVFLLRFTRFIGLYPNTSDYREGMYFDLLNSCFVNRVPLHGLVLLPQEAAKIQVLMRMNFDSMHLFKLNHNERNHILEVCMHYYRLHIPDMPELKSYTVLKELFNP